MARQAPDEAPARKGVVRLVQHDQSAGFAHAREDRLVVEEEEVRIEDGGGRGAEFQLTSEELMRTT